MKFGQLIKSERQKVNMRQDELAKGICSPSHLSKIESGTTTASTEVQQMLLQKLNISMENIFATSSPGQVTQFTERFKDVISQRDNIAGSLLYQEIHTFLEENPLFEYKMNLLLMETRLMLTMSTNFTDAKMNIAIILPTQSDLSQAQLFQLYIIPGIIAYTENRFFNALHLFTNAYKLTKKTRMADWEIADLHYVLSLAALSDYRYTQAIDHAQEALSYFNAKMLAARSIECLLILGIAHKHTGNVNDALVTFKNAEEIMKNSEAYRFLGIIEQNLGACYSLLQDSERSLHHFNQSLLAKEDPNKQLIAILSIVKEHKKIGDEVSAKIWVHKGITLLDQLTERNKNPFFHHFSIYKALLNDENNLISTFKSALHYFEEKQNYYHCFVYSNILAKKTAEKNQYKLATTFSQKAFDYHLKHRKVQHWEELT